MVCVKLLHCIYNIKSYICDALIFSFTKYFSKFCFPTCPSIKSGKVAWSYKDTWQGEGLSCKYLIREEAHLPFTWPGRKGFWSSKYIFSSSPPPPHPFSTYIMTSPLLISKKTAVANLSAPYDFPDNRIFISGNHCVILSRVQTVTFQKVKYKAPTIISHLIRRLDIPVLFFLELFKSCCW